MSIQVALLRQYRLTIVSVRYWLVALTDKSFEIRFAKLDHCSPAAFFTKFPQSATRVLYASLAAAKSSSNATRVNSVRSALPLTCSSVYSTNFEKPLIDVVGT